MEIIMKKWLVVGGAVVVIVVVLVVVGLSNLGPIIKKAVNSYGPRITKTEVRVGDVSVAMFSAEAKLKDFFLGNPEGFKSPQAMKVGSIHVDVDEGSLTKDTIIIDRIAVVAPEITYEKTRGTDNFKTILDNVQKAVGAETTGKTQTEKKGEGKKLLIRDFVLSDGKVNLAMSMLEGASVSASLPEIHLKNVGNKKEGVLPAEAFEEILMALYTKITSPVVAQSLKKGLEELGSSVKAAREGAEKQLETMKESAENQLETVKESAEKEARSVADQVKKFMGK
jgi:uncharacterized protein involved in outer membrane biogenesis